MDIKEFMDLKDEQKIKLFCLVDGDKENLIDIGIFNKEATVGYGMSCEICETKRNEKLIGTTDIREPKFCFEHYAEVNKNSIFVKEMMV